MNDDGVQAAVGCFFIGFLIGILAIGFFATPNHIWQKQAIDHGAAQYSPVTGKFEWKDGNK
ncbi:MAG: hypothetical protein EBW87_01105 [Burkholderiaceae bacterium]|nr:hypothetical protein [Burkholderiaceae bacterium]